MATSPKITTLHPQGKKGVNILQRRYDTIKNFLLKTIEAHGTISYEELNALAIRDLTNDFDGSVRWYVVTVKLDLEARKIIERIPKISPHELRMCKERQ
ncbi:MAG: DUF6958 family protein [Chitinophagales bacterium]